MNAARDLHRLLDTALGDDPHHALIATRRLRDELSGWVTERAVLNARRSGKSWARIARLLMISRQAAHRRFRHLDHLASVHDVPRPDRTSPPGDDNDRFADRYLNGRRADREFEEWASSGDVVAW